jgi:4-diphosphocytidyl-2-C-methyl-D-erythritol kinase
MGRTAFAPAKLNLFLHVGAPGDDGYHPICSLMTFADVGDRLRVDPSDALSFRQGGPFADELGRAEDNLAARAARALIARSRGPLPPLALTLDKRLPVAAGLGGGSSDAGAALRLLRAAFEMEASDAELIEIAEALGSDVPACLFGRPVIAEGRGERLSPAPVMPVLDAVLVNPRVAVSTAEVYRRFDADGRFAAVTRPWTPDAFESVEELSAWLALQTNDLEPAAIAMAPEVGSALELLSDEPESLIARMSGSGGTCFALCAGDIEAEALAERVESMCPDWWVSRCRLGGPWSDEG